MLAALSVISHLTDWLLAWTQNETELILILVDAGSHSDLF